MSTSDYLFELIKSLTKPEKRYFKLYAGSPGENYLRLFNAYDKIDKLDLNKFRAKHKGEKFLKNFSYNKNYLYGLLLSAMEDMGSMKGTLSMILKSSIHSNYLFQKGLYIQSNKIINKALKLAKKTENHEMVLHLLIQKLRNIVTMGRPLAQDRATDELHRMQYETLDIIKNKYDYHLLHREFFVIFKRMGDARNRQDMKKFDDIMKNVLFSDENLALSTDAGVRFFHDWVLYLYQKNEFDAAFDMAKRYLAFLEKRKPDFDIQPQHFYNARMNILKLSRITGRKEAFENGLAEIKKYHLSGINLSAILVEELQWRIKQLEIQSAESILNNIISLHNNDNSLMDSYTLSIIYITGCWLSIYMNDFHTALDRLNMFKSIGEQHTADDDIHTSNLLALVIHYELENYEVLESLLKSLNRQSSKNVKVNKTEKMLIKYFTKLLNAGGEDEKDEIFSMMKKDAAKLQADEYKSLIVNRFNFGEWAESKITKIPLLDISKKKLASGL